jgi:hypothetical protein
MTATALHSDRPARSAAAIGARSNALRAEGAALPSVVATGGVRRTYSRFRGAPRRSGR